jgi:hypothetical protein|tara:strand:+ start:2747 stop:2950 length:204 start_codon:yes stop_codon:yes gene_type:complete
MTKFKTGDLVKIRDGTHATEIPDHRVGMIIEHGDASGNYTEAYTVIFLGTDIQLKFHGMFLERLTPS